MMVTTWIVLIMRDKTLRQAILPLGAMSERKHFFSREVFPKNPRNHQKCTLFSKFKVTLAIMMQVGCIGTIHQAARAEKNT